MPPKTKPATKKQYRQQAKIYGYFKTDQTATDEERYNPVYDLLKRNYNQYIQHITNHF